MKRTRCAVIGVGYLGRFHALKYAALENAELVAVVDTSAHVALAVAAECGCRAMTDYRELLGEVEAVSIAVPTVLHYPIALDFLDHGSHVLVEKPMATTVAEAERLNHMAHERGMVLQVGHLERFNAALMQLAAEQVEPRFIESHRLAPFSLRSTDVDVVLDLMIHDIDITLSLVDSPVRSLRANGAQVLSSTTDIANARIEFANGCIANITASRVSQKRERKMRIFQKDAYISLDFLEKTISVCRLGEGELYPGVPALNNRITRLGDQDLLLLEIQAFLEAIQSGAPVSVDGEDGLAALEIALKITDVLQPTLRAVR